MDPGLKTIQAWQAAFEFLCNKTQCWCGYVGLDRLPLKSENHDGGYPVAGFTDRQWLYVTCPKCEFDWAIWKLGIVHPANYKED